jgi:hypothetical protein
MVRNTANTYNIHQTKLSIEKNNVKKKKQLYDQKSV